MERLAWLAATLINYGGNVKSAVSPLGLLGTEKPKPKRTAYEIERDRRELLERFGEE